MLLIVSFFDLEVIFHKHLLTLEAGISLNQTNQMQANHLQLVVPHRLHDSYTELQRTWLMDVSSFIELAQERQLPQTA